jgi:hypothetical protein
MAMADTPIARFRKFLRFILLLMWHRCIPIYSVSYHSHRFATGNMPFIPIRTHPEYASVEGVSRTARFLLVSLPCPITCGTLYH